MTDCYTLFKDWTAVHHEVERKQFIKRLQVYAQEKSVRVSFLGGDVHCCAAGRLYSKDKTQDEERDPYLMIQIVSSAIVNVPPPQILLTYLNQNACYINFDGKVQEEMYDLFHTSPNGNQVTKARFSKNKPFCIYIPLLETE